jgi:ABC-type nitrate/sulfonate/bicarbonate transport system substrate-binding protein
MFSKNFVLLSIVLFSFVFFTSQAIAVSYSDGTPITSQLSSNTVVNCRPGDRVKVPLITWGADMVTIYANGNSLRTQKGSLFSQSKLDLELYREDNFAKQLEAYLKCETPYLRATLGMANLVADITEKDQRTKMQAIYQHSWSAGGDALVVKQNIKSPKDLKGKTIALQKAGPHVAYLMTILKDSGLSPSDVNIKWTRDLVGFSGSTPGAAIQKDASIDAAMVIIPDALALSSGGSVGTGSEDSVKGAHILLSTRSANRVIADLYFVRADYLKNNRAQVEAFVKALFKSEEQLSQIMKNKSGAFKKTVKASAKILLDSEHAAADAEAMWADAETVGLPGNVKFFTDENYPRRYAKLNSDVQSSLVDLGQIKSQKPLGYAHWDYDEMAALGLSMRQPEAERFNQAAISKAITRQQAQGTIDSNTLFEFEINFKPNQDSFPTELYAKQFKRVVDLASTYSGAVITVEGHSDPLGYLRSKKEGKSQVILNMMVQSARNLSVSRAQEVRDSIITLANQEKVSLDSSQFVVVGLGFQDPKSGICGSDPCPPESEQEWLSNMRVVFRIVNVEAEASAFKPL